MSGKKAPAASENPFTDTTDPVILQAADLGFVSGVGGGKFEPDALVRPTKAAQAADWGILLLQRLEHFQGNQQGLLNAGAALGAEIVAGHHPCPVRRCLPQAL